MDLPAEQLPQPESHQRPKKGLLRWLRKMFMGMNFRDYAIAPLTSTVKAEVLVTTPLTEKQSEAECVRNPRT